MINKLDRLENALGRRGRGYMMAAEVFARPLFMIFGLLGAMLIMDPLLRIVNGMFMNAAGSVQTDSTTGIPTIIGLVVIYVVVCVTLVHKIFDLIHVLPNSAMRWIGGHASGHDQSGGVQENIRTAFLAAAAATRRALPSGFGLNTDGDGNIKGLGKGSKGQKPGDQQQAQHAPGGAVGRD